MPKSRQRCSTSWSSSSNEDSSRRISILSRAVSLPSRCWRSRRVAPPPSSARRILSRRTSSGELTLVAAAAPTTPATTPAAPRGSHAVGGREGEGGDLLLHVLAAAARAGHGFPPRPHEPLESLVALGADVFVDRHRA